METTNLMKAMRDSISDVLETMFFQMVQIMDIGSTLKEWMAQEQSLLGVTLTFDGPLAGSFCLIIPADAANNITANFLGLDADELDENQQKDTVKEALNMIGGNMLSALDQKGAFKLGLPELMKADDLVLDKLDGLQGDFVLFETENNHLAAGIVLDRFF